MRFTSRKFILAFCTVLLSSGLRVGGYIDVSSWAMVVNAAVLGYLTANVTQKATQKTAEAFPEP